MAHMSSNAEIPRRKYGDRSQLTNCILESSATCYMTLEILYFVFYTLLIVGNK